VQVPTELTFEAFYTFSEKQTTTETRSKQWNVLHITEIILSNLLL